MLATVTVSHSTPSPALNRRVHRPPAPRQLAGLNPTTPRITPRHPIRALPTPRSASRGYVPSDPAHPVVPGPSPTKPASPAAVVAAATTPPSGGCAGARPAASLPRRPIGPSTGGGVPGEGGGGTGGWDHGPVSEEDSIDATETEADGDGCVEDGALPHYIEWQQRHAK
jgi:hypothetical protein